MLVACVPACVWRYWQAGETGTSLTGKRKRAGQVQAMGSAGRRFAALGLNWQ